MAASNGNLVNLAKRTLTALIGAPLVIAVVLAGPRVFFPALLAAAVLGVNESLRLARRISPATPGLLLAFAYVVLPISCLGLIYSTRLGPMWVIFTFIATWLADTAAYVVGGLIGRRPLAARISPNKTVEGALGGLAVTASILAALTFVPVLSMAQRFLFGLALAPTAIAGDLFESWLKRRAGVKDSGNLLPGHGGFLDRIDSLLFTAPLSYLLLRLWI